MGVSLTALVGRIDAARSEDDGSGNLSSALRLYALAYLRKRAGV